MMFADCGIGSDPGSSGPCTGSYGPEQLGQSVTSVLGSGQLMLWSIGAALLALAVVLLLLEMAKRALRGTKASGKPSCSAEGEVDEVECNGCRELVPADEMRDGMCASCWSDMFGEEGGGELPGPTCDICGARDMTGTRDVGDSFLCPDCIAARSSEDSEMEGAELCVICGEPVDPGTGIEGMSGVVHQHCEAEAEIAARAGEIDWDGPEGDNPNGVGARDEGVRG